jgi:hypothetical protein
VPLAEQTSGRSRRGYRCNVEPVGQNTIGGRGANMQLAWYGDCAYVSIIGVREFFPWTANPKVEGVGVLDASDPAHPRHVRTLFSPVGRNHHEGLEVNDRRGMLVVEVGGISARYIEIYDISRDCRDPQLKARYDAGEGVFHGLRISDDGNTIYATDGIGFGSPEAPLHVIDVTHMSKPRLITKWGPGQQPFFIIHDLDVSPDGTRAYLGTTPVQTSIPGLGITAVDENVTGPTMAVLDTTDIRDRRPNPQLKMIGRADTPQFGHTVKRMTIGGKPFVVASGESPFSSGINCPWAWGYLIDISDERSPKVTSQLKLDVNEAQNCVSAREDEVTYSIHYVGVDDERRTTKVFYTYYGAGLRVFDVRDAARPVEVGYYHPDPQLDTILQPLADDIGGDAAQPEWDSATSMVRYRPESGHLWFASVAGGLNIVRMTGDHACVPAAARARGRRLGGVTLGRTRAQHGEALAARVKGTRAGTDRYCTTDGHSLRIGYRTARGMRGRAIFALTNSSFGRVRGIAPGARVSGVRARLRGADRLRRGSDTWFLTRSGSTRAVFRARRGVIREAGIAVRGWRPAG